MNKFKNSYYDRKGPNKRVIEKKIKGMFDAVFEPRKEFMSLSKSSQDLLLGTLMNDIIDGFYKLELDLFARTPMI
jgi:hypothetical protein